MQETVIENPVAAPTDPSPTVSRWIIISFTTVATLVATWFYGTALSIRGGVNVLEWLSIPIFALLFGWIVFSFGLACLGLKALLQDRRHQLTCHADERPSTPCTLDGSEPIGSPSSNAPSSRACVLQSDSATAILMPVYNESPHRVFAGLRAMIASLRESSQLDRFHFYILSDTTDPEVWLQEEHAWSDLVRQEPDSNVFYRHRPKNTSRKAGNIADFCARWGSKHRYMIVLDADSLMDGGTMREMVRRMDSDASLGILQVPPVPIGRQSLFARLQQFSAAAYGGLFVRGFARWAGSEGNYWGHNAILRVEPFLDHCELPLLPGKKPLGGEILSHDFVEAALMLRSGWKVEIATDLSGSYEECPTTLTDYAMRDQRWCQGNLQHSRLVISKGFAFLSRVHFASGVMAYVASPLWITMTLLCIGGTILDRNAESTLASNPASTSAALPIALVLFVVSMTLLILPKVFSLGVISLDSDQRKHFGGMAKLWGSGMIEIVASILLSPIMAIYHSRFVISTFLGTSVRWGAQQRDEHGVKWSEAIGDFSFMTLIGIVSTVLLATFYPTMLVWFSPLLVGLLLSVPVAVAMGSGGWGRFLRKHQLLLIPAESSLPPVAREHQKFLSQPPPSSLSDAMQRFGSLLDAVICDPAMFVMHRDIQKQSNVNVPLPTNQSKAIEAAWAAGGGQRIPPKLRSSLLNDSATMQALHIEAQLSDREHGGP